MESNAVHMNCFPATPLLHVLSMWLQFSGRIRSSISPLLVYAPLHSQGRFLRCLQKPISGLLKYNSQDLWPILLPWESAPIDGSIHDKDILALLPITIGFDFGMVHCTAPILLPLHFSLAAEKDLYYGQYNLKRKRKKVLVI